MSTQSPVPQHCITCSTKAAYEYTACNDNGQGVPVTRIASQFELVIVAAPLR